MGSPSPPALDRPAGHRRTRHFAGPRQPHPEAPRPPPPSLRSNRPGAASGKRRASRSTSTPRNSARSTASTIASPTTAAARSRPGSGPCLTSTMPPGSPAPRFCPTRRSRAPARLPRPGTRPPRRPRRHCRGRHDRYRLRRPQPRLPAVHRVAHRPGGEEARPATWAGRRLRPPHEPLASAPPTAASGWRGPWPRGGSNASRNAHPTSHRPHRPTPPRSARGWKPSAASAGPTGRRP